MQTFVHPDKLITNPDEIPSLLDQCGVPIDSWGQGTSRTLEDLQLSVAKDEVAIEDTGGRPLIHVRNAVVYVQFLGVSDFELWEEYIEFNRAGMRHRLTRDFRGISETMTKGERPDATARRLLRKQPGYSNEGFRNSGNYFLTTTASMALGPQPSEKWPGLDAKFFRNVFLCHIKPILYDPLGYYEINGDRKTVMSWRSI